MNRTPTPIVKKEEAPHSKKIKVKTYRWINKDGVLQFSENPPLNPDVKAEVMEVVTKAEPKDKDKVLLYAKELKGKNLRTNGGNANVIRSGRKLNTSAMCESAKRAVSSARRKPYTNYELHKRKMRRLEARVRTAC